jgi:hypothetical protein
MRKCIEKFDRNYFSITLFVWKMFRIIYSNELNVFKRSKNKKISKLNIFSLSIKPNFTCISPCSRILSRQSATEAITKNIPTFIITKTKQATILIKNQNCFIHRHILAIVCTMVKVHQSSIPPSWVGVRRTRSSYIEYHGQTTQQLFFLHHSETPPPTRGICSHKERERLSSPAQTSQCNSYKVVLNELNPRRMNLLMRRPPAGQKPHTTSCTCTELP